ncbi:MAG: hypothetical protein J0M29_09500 [Chitinophagales bacterium]|nr:hypothetical protein [Chitinophagales bacterium]HLP93476.1 hypothetical protein [Saprospiraceae bacterium]
MEHPESCSSVSFSSLQPEKRQLVLFFTAFSTVVQIPPEKLHSSDAPRGAAVAIRRVTEKSKTSKRSM